MCPARYDGVSLLATAQRGEEADREKDDHASRMLRGSHEATLMLMTLERGDRYC